MSAPNVLLHSVTVSDFCGMVCRFCFCRGEGVVEEQEEEEEKVKQRCHKLATAEEEVE
jgi:L-lysine 2,3-aminomutase